MPDILPPEVPDESQNVPVIYKNSLISKENLLLDGEAAFVSRQRIPSWNTLGRPNKPKAGTVGFNFQTLTIEYWNGTVWLKLPMKKIE